MAAPTLAEFREHVRLPGTGNSGDPGDEVVGSYLTAAIEHVEDRCGPLSAGTVTLRVHTRAANGLLVLPVTRVDSIVQVRDPDGTVGEVDLDASNLDAGIVRVRPRRRGAWEVDLTRDAASQERLHLAVLIIAEHLFDVRRQGYERDGRLAPVEGGRLPAGFAVSRRAMELMQDWLVPATA